MMFMRQSGKFLLTEEADERENRKEKAWLQKTGTIKSFEFKNEKVYWRTILMKDLVKNINLSLIKAITSAKCLLKKNDGFGMNEILGIAVGLIIAAFVVIPQLKIVSLEIMSGLAAWWKDTISKVLFPTAFL